MALAQSQNVVIKIILSDRPSVCLTVSFYQEAPTGPISVESRTGKFYEIISRDTKFG